MATKKQPQPKFFVNDKDFTKEAEALNELAKQKNAKSSPIVFIDVKAKTKTTYTLQHKNYYVDAEVYTPTAGNKSIADDSNNRDNADILQDLQPTAE